MAMATAGIGTLTNIASPPLHSGGHTTCIWPAGVLTMKVLPPMTPSGITICICSMGTATAVATAVAMDRAWTHCGRASSARARICGSLKRGVQYSCKKVSSRW